MTDMTAIQKAREALTALRKAVVAWESEEGAENIDVIEAACRVAKLPRRSALAALAETPATPEEPAALVERFKEFLGYFDAIETLPRVAELYYAVKNEGSGTGWRYVATGFGPSDIRDAAIALCIAILRAAEESAG